MILEFFDLGIYAVWEKVEGILWKWVPVSALCFQEPQIRNFHRGIQVAGMVPRLWIGENKLLVYPLLMACCALYWQNICSSCRCINYAWKSVMLPSLCASTHINQFFSVFLVLQAARHVSYNFFYDIFTNIALNVSLNFASLFHRLQSKK